MGNELSVLKSAQKAIKKTNVSTSKLAMEKWDFANWLTGHIRTKHGGQVHPYSFKGYEPYMQIANELHLFSENWFLKGTQIGFSTLMIGWNLYLPYWRGYDSGYALPDKVMIKPFMKTRFGKEQLDGNKDLAWIYKAHESDFFFDCGPHYLYFLGANVLTEQMTRPMDQLSLDEVTVIKKDAIEMIGERMDKSSFAQLNGFAREIYPGGPADAGFQDGRQNVMLFKCPHCNTDDQNLEEKFYHSSLAGEKHPTCVAQIDGNWQVVCTYCGKPYSRAECGRWVAKHPDRDINSYRLPQVIFEGMDLQGFMRRWLASHGKKSKRAKRHSSALAIPDAGDLQRVTKDTFLRLKRKYSVQRQARWSVGGMDMGDIVWPTFAAQDEGSQQLRVIWQQAADSDHVYEIVKQLIIEMQCIKFVIDGMPLTTDARRLAYEFPDIVVLSRFSGNEIEEAEADHLGKEYKVVKQDREQCLDAYCDALTSESQLIVFPERVLEMDGSEVDLVESTFVKHHLRGSQKDEVEDKRAGKKVKKFKKNIPNHSFLSMAYLWTAYCLLTQQRGQFVGVAPVGGSLM